jgi:hypothetical protein
MLVLPPAGSRLGKGKVSDTAGVGKAKGKYRGTLLTVSNLLQNPYTCFISKPSGSGSMDW